MNRMNTAPTAFADGAPAAAAASDMNDGRERSAEDRLPAAGPFQEWLDALGRRAGVGFSVVMPDGIRLACGPGQPVFTVVFHTDGALLSTLTRGPIGLLEAYFVGFLIYAVLPLDLTISAGELAAKYREASVERHRSSRLRGRCRSGSWHRRG